MLETIMHYPPEHITQFVGRAFPDWKIEGISSHTTNGWQWVQHEDFDLERLCRRECVLPLTELPRLAGEGATQVCLKLTHKNGGIAHPDYFVAELAVPFRWQPNDHLRVDVNQGMRDAYVLAVIGDEALIEYEMPAGTTALWVIRAGDPGAHKRRNLSYRACPKKWRDAMDEAGTVWEGEGQ